MLKNSVGKNMTVLTEASRIFAALRDHMKERHAFDKSIAGVMATLPEESAGARIGHFTAAGSPAQAVATAKAERLERIRTMERLGKREREFMQEIGQYLLENEAVAERGKEFRRQQVALSKHASAILVSPGVTGTGKGPFLEFELSRELLSTVRFRLRSPA